MKCCEWPVACYYEDDVMSIILWHDCQCDWCHVILQMSWNVVNGMYYECHLALRIHAMTVNVIGLHFESFNVINVASCFEMACIIMHVIYHAIKSMSCNECHAMNLWMPCTVIKVM